MRVRTEKKMQKKYVRMVAVHMFIYTDNVRACATYIQEIKRHLEYIISSVITSGRNFLSST